MVIALILTVFLLGASAQGDRHSPSAAASGAQSFKTYCASCHGTGAKGDGPLAEHLKVLPADLTAISQRNGGQFPFDDVRKKIDGRESVAGHGTTDMPVWGDAFKQSVEGYSEKAVKARIDALVEYLKSIQAK